MELPGWSWLLVGIIVSGMSGYIYLALPRNGEPNGAMALFFFIGIIFLAVGIFKILFKEKEGNPMITSKEHFRAPEAETLEKLKMQHPMNKEKNVANQNHSHTSAYARNHPYHAPSQNNSAVQHHQAHIKPTHTPHHANAHNQPAHNQIHQSHAHTNVKSSTHSTHIACPSCGYRVYGTNFCHNCGTRLR